MNEQLLAVLTEPLLLYNYVIVLVSILKFLVAFKIFIFSLFFVLSLRYFCLPVKV